MASYSLPIDEVLRFKGAGGSAASPNVITVNNLTLNPFAYIQHASGDSDYFALAGSLLINGGAIVVQGQTYIQSLVSGVGTLGIGSPSNNQGGRVVHFTNGSNTFAGNIVLTNTSPGNFANPAASRIALDSTGVLNFVIGANGVSNYITGVTTPANSIATYNGAFNFDLSGASAGFNDSWAVATVPNQTFGATFTVNGFTNVGGGRWNAAAHGAVYQFSQATGRLTVVAVPEPAGFILFGSAAIAFAARRPRRLLRYHAGQADRDEKP